MDAPAVDLATVDSARRLLCTFFNIATAWELSALDQETLLGVGESTCDAWRDGKITAALPTDTLERLGYILNIYACLQSLLPVREHADPWLRQPNSALAFGGRPALERMIGGRLEDLKFVSDYLDAQMCAAP
jgi:hypothetical protein